ncbi:hypothetical protein GEV33_014603 [Tenebrio molitor]|uniref:Uncharacterized protein n=1 Tax=Tenebrio molitor TaxID=7067 RepID=A0A8J6H6I4_TENMO|nr:hypothetical protein GEV33_014603 [Tenebrio molitor]
MEVAEIANVFDRRKSSAPRIRRKRVPGVGFPIASAAQKANRILKGRLCECKNAELSRNGWSSRGKVHHGPELASGKLKMIGGK